MNPYLLVLIAGMATLLALAGWRLDVQGKELSAAKAALEVERTNEKVVEKYVDRVVEVERSRPIVGVALERLCNRAGMSRPGHSDAATAADPNHGQDEPTIQGLADDVTACRLNGKQLAAIQEVVREQQ